MTVDVIHATRSKAHQVLDTSGGLFAWQEVSIGTEISGYRLAEVLVDVGSVVTKGRVLARLDDTLLKQAVDQAEASLAVTNASRDQARNAARRGEALRRDGLISQQDFDQLTTNLATTTAQAQSAESLLKSAKQRLDYATVRATANGVIATREVSPGQIINAGATLFTLIRDQRIEWRAELPARWIGKVRAGMRAKIKRTDGSEAAGVVRTVSPGLDAGTQRGIAYVDLKMEPQVRPGLYVTGSIELPVADVLTIPLSAMSVRDGFSYVFIIDDKGTVRQRRVTVNRIVDDHVELLDGVTEQESLVANGVGLLHDADPVMVRRQETTP